MSRKTVIMFAIYASLLIGCRVSSPQPNLHTGSRWSMPRLARLLGKEPATSLYPQVEYHFGDGRVANGVVASREDGSGQR